MRWTPRDFTTTFARTHERGDRDMTYKVQYTRFFEEFGCTDIDTREFESLRDAYEFMSELVKQGDKNAKMYAGNDRIA